MQIEIKNIQTYEVTDKLKQSVLINGNLQIIGSENENNAQSSISVILEQSDIPNETYIKINELCLTNYLKI